MSKRRPPPKQKFGVIYADPAWKFVVWGGENTGTGMLIGVADNHYPCLPIEAIKAIAPPAADDAALFLWATVPMLPQALEVMAAWGFTYKSHCAWVKDRAGTGYIFRNRHELLLYGTRGNVPAPATAEFESVVFAARGKHSEKPAICRTIIETLFPSLPKVEMFARGKAPPGWTLFGQ